MVKQIAAAILTLFIVFGFSMTVLRAEEKIVSIATIEYVPYVGKNLKDYGTTSKLVTKAFKRSGYKTSIHFMPWSRAIMKTEEGKYDAVFPAFYTKERAEKFYYSDVIAKGIIGFIKRKDSPITYKILKDLRSYKIGVIRGYANTVEFDAADYLKKLTVNSDLIGIKKLLAKQIDLVITDKLVAQHIIDNSFKDEAGTIEFMWPPLEEMPLYLMVSREINGAAEIVKQFNQGLKLISGDSK